MQISQAKSSCSEALKELKEWMKPEKVNCQENTTSFNMALLINNQDSFFFTLLGEYFNHNISIISRDCARTTRGCAGHLNMELSFLNVEDVPFSLYLYI